MAAYYYYTRDHLGRKGDRYNYRSKMTLLLRLTMSTFIYDRLDVGKTIDRQNRVTTNQYDAIRELLQTTDPLGRTTFYTWCTCGGLSTLTDANHNVTTWGLDGEGRVTSKTYADGSVINYVYESNTSRLHSMTDALTNQYNAAHSTSYVTATYTYNNDNTLYTTIYGAVPGVPATSSGTFTYDPVYNRVTSMVDLTGTTTYAYNTISGTMTTGAGRLHTVAVPVDNATGTMTYTGTVTYAYDALGRVNNRQLDTGNTVTTGFDSLGRVTSVTNALSPTGSFTYAYADSPAPSNRLASVIYPASTGLSTSYTYFGNTSSDGNPGDGDQRLQEIKNMSGSTQLSKFDYTYNPVGTISTWTTQSGTTTAVVNTLSYDNADQLTGCTATGTIPGNTYRYDPAGNRLAGLTLSGTTVTATTSGTFNSLNQLLKIGPGNSLTISGTTTLSSTFVSINGVTGTLTSSTSFTAPVALPTGTNSISVIAVPTSSNIAPVTKRFSPLTTAGTAPTSLTYDANGNTLTDENGNAYSWDALNRLTKITYPSTAYTTMAYDGLSRRTQIEEYNSSHALTSTKNYIWIGSEIAEERDASNNVTKRFFPQGEQQSGTNYYYTRDHLGSVREMCSSTGTITSRMAYDPYGRTTTVSGTVLPTKQYGGYYTNQTSGLNLTKYRAYDANTGKWLSRDPKGENGGLNLYVYCHNKPINFVDPVGLSAGTFDLNFTPPTGGPGQEPNPNGFNQPVQINYHKDPKECCKNIILVQWFSQDGSPETIDTGGAPISTKNPAMFAATIAYPGYSKTDDGAKLQDEPGPDTFAEIAAVMLFGTNIDFKTCAVCTDSYPFHVLGCTYWGVRSAMGVSHYPNSGTYPAEP